MIVVLLYFSLGPQLGYSNHQYGKQPLFLKQASTGNLLGERLFVAESKEAMGSISGCFLALLEAVCLFCCFFPPFSLCRTHSLQKAGFTQLSAIQAA